jgi:UDP-N-acetylenolpyruvoylglucosamine reductase
MRRSFIKEIELERLITLFKQMFKNNHDGMIITEGKNILMHNKTFSKIFKELTKDRMKDPSQEISNINCQTRRED